MTPQTVFLLAIGAFLVVVLLRMLQTRSVRQYRPSEVVEKLRKEEKVLLVDVRTESERQFQYIKGSLHIPMCQLRDRAHELRRHADKEIVCYCQSGNRSLTAAIILRKHGVTASSMRGGIVDWNFLHRSS